MAARSGSDDGAAYEVKRSLIHGRGLFATRALRTGTRIGVLEGRVTTRDGDHVLWITEEDGREWGLRGENELRFVNHSADPNADFDGADLIAIRRIKPGDEITCDYGSAG